MSTLALALGLLCVCVRVAAADGWVDCNGPDKHGKGCDASGTHGATTGVGLALVSAVAYSIGRKRRH